MSVNKKLKKGNRRSFQTESPSPSCRPNNPTRNPGSSSSIESVNMTFHSLTTKEIEQIAINSAKKALADFSVQLTNALENIEDQRNSIAQLVQEIKLRDEKISNLETLLNNKSREMDVKLNDFEQYSRNCSIRIRGLSVKNDDYKTSVSDFLEQDLKIKLRDNEITTAHIILPKNKKDNSERNFTPPVIVKLANENIKLRVLKERYKLKGKRVVITEDLTRMNIQLLNRLKNDDRMDAVWSYKGRVWGKLKSTQQKGIIRLYQTVEEAFNLK